jgi:peptidyl-prolyl cis-trans isomerase A (cyclophilin A)
MIVATPTSSLAIFATRLKRCVPVLLICGALGGQTAQATTVQIQTVLGDVTVNLFDRTTPKTVANFLSYVNANAYVNNVVHRVEPGFVVQAGGHYYAGSLPLNTVAANAAVANEPVYSNVRGTIAMAKLGTDPNSATTQWFINLADNSQNLDKQNGGFTVFGQVTGNGMAIMDAIAALNRFSFDSTFTSVPLRNYTAADATAGKLITGDNLVLIPNILVLDANPDTAASLVPVKNTLISAPPPAQNGGGGGGVGIAGLVALALIVLQRAYGVERKGGRTTSRCRHPVIGGE